MTLQAISTHKCFGGDQGVYTHTSTSTGTEMTFSVFMPEQSNDGPVPVLFYLSGLTCSWENFTVKGGAQRFAAEHGIAIVSPDTSPRGSEVPDDNDFDMGQGAGFYVNATQSPWSNHYHMYDYVVDELPKLIELNFPVSEQRAISGHSMGGHGALTIAMLNPKRYKSMSAFSPICNPINSPWGKKAFTAYLGKDIEHWKLHDASELMQRAKVFVPAMVDQGTTDDFLKEQLKPDTLILAATINGYPLTLNNREGYDHSYYFIASFIEEHLRFHAMHLRD